jgi:hypothetical protein
MFCEQKRCKKKYCGRSNTGTGTGMHTGTGTGTGTGMHTRTFYCTFEGTCM